MRQLPETTGMDFGGALRQLGRPTSLAIGGDIGLQGRRFGKKIRRPLSAGAIVGGGIAKSRLTRR